MDRFSNYADYKDLLLRISEIEEALALLPAGSIGKKTVNGKTAGRTVGIFKPCNISGTKAGHFYPRQQGLSGIA